jgi:hypothetical protein
MKEKGLPNSQISFEGPLHTKLALLYVKLALDIRSLKIWEGHDLKA